MFVSFLSGSREKVSRTTTGEGAIIQTGHGEMGGVVDTFVNKSQLHSQLNRPSGAALRVDILSFAAASGHESAAAALRYGLSRRYPHWIVRIVDVEEIFRHRTRRLHVIHNLGIRWFNWCMRRESYWFFEKCIRSWIRFVEYNTRVRSKRPRLQRTAEFWGEAPPDVLLSVTPMTHTLVYESARCINPDVLCVTIPVDYCEMSPGYWFQPAIPQKYLLGWEGLRDVAIRSGVPSADIRDLSGMIIDPRFYSTASIDRRQILNALELDSSLPTGVISFGGQGTVNVLRSAKRIAEAGVPVNLICLCGRNQQLPSAIKRLETPYPVAAVSFDPEPPVDFLRIADFLIGKPGTMTLNEALITNTPLIFIKSTGLSAVQEENEAWILSQGIGVMAQTAAHVDGAVREVLDNADMRNRIEASRHTGIFDGLDAIADFVESTVSNTRTAT